MCAADRDTYSQHPIQHAKGILFGISVIGRMKQQRRIPVRDENDLQSILQKDGIDVKQFGAGQDEGFHDFCCSRGSLGVVLLAPGVEIFRTENAKNVWFCWLSPSRIGEIKLQSL